MMAGQHSFYDGKTLGHDPESLPFHPPESRAWVREGFQRIPQFLFRVFTPNSDGATDHIWAKSKDAKEGKIAKAKTDLFSLPTKLAAYKLYNHFNWVRMHDEDNLVSWTSSLLFALQYIAYRHCSRQDGSSLEDIKLCIIMTTCFPSGTFLRDLDLIETFQDFCHPLYQYGELKRKKPDKYSSSFEFGEYLSQGMLRIENKCHIVSAKSIIDCGICILPPNFKQLVHEQPLENRLKADWSDEVVRLREPFYQTGIKHPLATKEELQATIDVAHLFGPAWRLPVAANLLSLTCRPGDDKNISRFFRNTPFTDEERSLCSPDKTKIISCKDLPEVEQYRRIMHGIFIEYCHKKVKDSFQATQIALNTAIYFKNELQRHVDPTSATAKRFQKDVQRQSSALIATTTELQNSKLDDTTISTAQRLTIREKLSISAKATIDTEMIDLTSSPTKDNTQHTVQQVLTIFDL